MSISLLYNTSMPKSYDISALGIDSIVSSFCKDKHKADYFVSTLSRPLQNIDDIRKRRDIFSDFSKSDGLIEELSSCLIRYDRLRDDMVFVYSSKDYNEGDIQNIDGVWSDLSKASLFPKTLISFYTSIANVLSKYDIKSDTLLEIKQYAQDMSKSSSLVKLSEITSVFRGSSPDGLDFEMAIGLGERLEVDFCALYGVNVSKPDSLLSKLKKRKNAPKTAEGEACDQARLLLCQALMDIDKVLGCVVQDIYDKLYGLSYELAFYEVALGYVDFLKKQGIPFSYATMENSAHCAHKLYDPYLATNGLDGTKIVPNEYLLEKRINGILIKGENGAGKTTFLRSIALSYIFNQSGLFVSAMSANLGIVNGIYIHFSHAEEDFGYDTAGRFEGEVREIATTLANIEPNSLVILNEVFQTTSFEEGADAIEDILDIFPSLEVRYIFVTHLTKLFNFEKSDVKKLTFDLNTHQYNTM